MIWYVCEMIQLNLKTRGSGMKKKRYDVTWNLRRCWRCLVPRGFGEGFGQRLTQESINWKWCEGCFGSERCSTEGRWQRLPSQCCQICSGLQWGEQAILQQDCRQHHRGARRNWIESSDRTGAKTSKVATAHDWDGWSWRSGGDSKSWRLWHWRRCNDGRIGCLHRMASRAKIRGEGECKEAWCFTIAGLWDRVWLWPWSFRFGVSSWVQCRCRHRVSARGAALALPETLCRSFLAGDGYDLFSPPTIVWVFFYNW